MSIRRGISGKERREVLENSLNVRLSHIGSGIITDEDASFHCENFIGATQIPLGVAGPVDIVNDDFTIDSHYIPLATTEGALVASVNRGCKAIAKSGGAKIVVELVGATRGAVFVTSGIKQSQQVKKWMLDNFELIAQIAASTSSHLRLLNVDFALTGKNIFVRFYYDTQDAMGLNMVTIASTKVCNFLAKTLKIKCVAVAGNYDIDKKAAWLNFIEGRGKKVWAEIILKKEVVKTVLKTTCFDMAEVVYRKCQIGSAMAGSMGFNAHYANAAAAIFAATGQDLAHVVEASLGITTAEVLPSGDLYFSIYLPSVMCGTVGGGTGLPTQKEALAIMGITGAGDSIKFARIVASAILAVEISLVASLAEGTLAKAHEKLGRGKQ